MIPLDEQDVVVIDCQTTGASPQHGHLLELAWSVGRAADPGWRTGPTVVSHLVRLPEGARIPPRIAKLTGIRDADLECGLPAVEARERMLAAAPPVAVAHFARFERAFLEERAPLPLELLCTHEIACRLMPGLPRRGLRALAGYFGHVMSEEKRAAGHVRATVAVWSALVEALREGPGVTSLDQLRDWTGSVAPVRTGGREYQVDRETRLALPERPGIYRMLAKGGAVLYVGKATSLKSRVNSYFRKRGDGRTMTPELLTQTSALDVTETASPLEAALLECDEIKRLAPPYNKALRGRSIEIRFATRDLTAECEKPDRQYRVGPLPHRDAVACISALRELLTDPARAGEDPVWHRALGFPVEVALEDAHLPAGLAQFQARWDARPGTRALLGLGARIWKERAREREEPDPEEEESDAEESEEPSGPRPRDPDEAARMFESAVCYGARVVRRARWLRSLSESVLVWRPRNCGARLLVIEGGMPVRCEEYATDHAPRSRPASERRRCFDAATYDRLRVLTTELRRVVAEGGALELRLGSRLRLDRASLGRRLFWV